MTLEFLAPVPAWSLNQERAKHWSWRAKRAKEWHTAAMWAWSVLPKTVRLDWVQHPCTVRVFLPVSGNRRRDPHNWIPAVKAIIDGLVERGVWPDDTPKWVTVAEPVLEVRDDGMVRVELEAR